MSNYTVTIEYTGDEFPVNLNKEVLRSINKVLEGYKLKTNLGVDIRTTEGNVINGKQHFEGIEIGRL